MAGKLHSIGKYIPLEDRERNGYLKGYINSETLCGFLFKLTDRNPFPDTEEGVTCKLCLKIMNQK